MRPLSSLLLCAAVLGAAAAPAAALQVVESDLPSNASVPLGIAAGPDGQAWFVEKDSSRFGFVSPAGETKDFSSGSGISADAEPWGIAAGPDGGMWFTEQKGNRIGRINPATRTAVEFSTGLSPNAAPRGIAAGPDGAVWFTEDAGNRIGRITTAGVISEFSTGISAGSRPLGITTGPDGNLWFTELDRGVARITPAGVVTEFTDGIPPGSFPQGIAAGPDGNLWFAQIAARIGRITPAGVVTQFPLTTSSQARSIVAGPDGAMWFTDEGLHRAVGRITTAGVVTSFPLTLAGNAAPIEMTAGPGRELWITTSANRVARIRLAPSVVTGDAVPGAGSAVVAGTVDPFASDTSWSVQFGPTTAYGSATAPRVIPPGPGPVAVSATLARPGPGATVHYRVVATSIAGTTVGADRTVTTAPGGAGGAGGGAAPLDRTGPRVGIRGGRIAVPSSGRVALRLSCPLAETLGCAGTVRLVSAARIRVGRPLRARFLDLGSARVKLRGGETRAVTVRLSAGARALARRPAGLRARAVVVARDVSGNRATTTRAVLLRGAAH